jgi:hypothetical protein
LKLAVKGEIGVQVLGSLFILAFAATMLFFWVKGMVRDIQHTRWGWVAAGLIVPIIAVVRGFMPYEDGSG